VEAWVISRAQFQTQFLQFGIHENAVTITDNALKLQLLGALLPAPPLGAQNPDRFAPNPN